MRDELIIAQALGGEVRIHAARSTEMVDEARKAHKMMQTSTAALGRTMTVTALMASDLKRDDEHVTVRINGGGPIGVINVQADGACNVRGYVGNPLVYLSREDGHLDVGYGVGVDGELVVTKDIGLKEPFTGHVELQTGEIGDDFAYYFAVSEQTPSVVAVGVLVNQDFSVKAAGGMVIQLLPGASEETIQAVEAVLGVMKPMTEYMDTDITITDLIKTLFPDAEVLQERTLRWNCGCSKDIFTSGLATLRDADLEEIIREDHGAEIVCQYCETKYQFSEEELQGILEFKKRVEDRKRFNQ